MSLLKKENNLIGLTIKELLEKVGKADTVVGGVYTYKSLASQTGDSINWILTITDGRVSKYKRQNETNPDKEE